MREIGAYIAKNTAIHRLDPLAKLIAFILFLSASIIASTSGGIGLIILVTFIIIFISKIPIKVLFKPLKSLWLFFLIIFLMNAFLSGEGEALWSWRFLSVSEGSLSYSFKIIFHVVMAVIISSIYTATSTPKEITDALALLLHPLSFVRVPTDQIASILSISLQLIPILTDEAGIIIRAQTARGAGIEGRGIKAKISGIKPLILPLFIAAFRRADEMALAMEARGYRGEKGRTHRRRLSFSKREFITYAIMLSLLTAEILLRRFS